MSPPEVRIQDLDASVLGRVHRLLGVRPVAARRVAGGYSPAARFLLDLPGGGAVFAKVATLPPTQEGLLVEGRVYGALRGRFLPRVLGFDPGPPAILLLEDLSAARWPPPWKEGDVAAVLAALAEVHGSPPPSGLPALADAREMREGWAQVEEAPAPFLSLGMASPRWLAQALSALREAERTAPIAGGCLLHQDVRSDNLALGPEGARLVDWSWAAVGSPDVDVAFWLPSLAEEGGPAPETVYRGDPRIAAIVAGWFASRAGLAPCPGAPRVREVQLRQLRTALPWAARALGLPPPDLVPPDRSGGGAEGA